MSNGITRDQFETYESIRQSGATNMFDVVTVQALSAGVLTRDTIMEIMAHYGELKGIYNENPKISHLFDPADCGGAFDGTNVTSDADPGL